MVSYRLSVYLLGTTWPTKDPDTWPKSVFLDIFYMVYCISDGTYDGDSNSVPSDNEAEKKIVGTGL